MRHALACVVLSTVLLAASCGGRPSPSGADGEPPIAGSSGAGSGSVGSAPIPAPPLPCDADWLCIKNAAGRTVCSSENGLPPGGSRWQCHLAIEHPDADCWDCEELRWICVGQAASSGASPGGCGWACRQTSPPTTWRCERPDGDGDRPPGSESSYWCKFGQDASCFTCAKGSAIGGTRCELASERPHGPSLGDSCVAGERVWCDGLMYGPWGQAACDPATGTWKTKIVNGKAILDCQELATGAVPATACACFHFFFNPQCCERLDCKVLAETSGGQRCAPSPGGLCDYCMPTNPECADPDARCIVTNSHETFCGRFCSTDRPCPSGYTCMAVKAESGTTQQCVPGDLSCYY